MSSPSLAPRRTYLLIGGTGTLGTALVAHLLETGQADVRVFARGEKRHAELNEEYCDHDAFRGIIGDVRDIERLQVAMAGVDVVVHAAALKHVPICEGQPEEAIRTNVLGALNVKSAALAQGVATAVVIGTDKAVQPINVMGLTKALQERVMLCDSIDNCVHPSTTFVCTRYGNVLGSRGSVLWKFADSVRTGQPMQVTRPSMTRYIVSVEEAVGFVMTAASEAQSGILIKPSPSAELETLAQAVACALTGDREYPIDVIGGRGGEKDHETLALGGEVDMAREHGDNLWLGADAAALAVEHDDGASGPLTSATAERISWEELVELVEAALRSGPV